MNRFKSTFSRFISEMALMVLLISFLGWCIETVYCCLNAGRFHDSGFLILPFCMIYGIPFVLLYVILGTPIRGRFFQIVNRIPAPMWLKYILSFGLFFLISAFTATAFELIIGLFFDKVFHIMLWGYQSAAHNFNGYISLESSLLWGLLITVAMTAGWDLLYRPVQKLSDRMLYCTVCIMYSLIFMDFLFNFSWLIFRGERFFLF